MKRQKAGRRIEAIKVVAPIGLIFATALAACGYTDAGGGSHSLEVQARLTYQAVTTDTTAVRFTVTKNGIAVPSANIAITDADTNQVFTVGNKINEATYQADIPGYHRRVTIKVESGLDNLSCKLEGPGRHTLVGPTQGASVSRGNDLSVSWLTTDGIRADEVTVALTLATSTNTTVDDSGSFSVPSKVLQTGTETVKVTRRNRVIPAGGLGSSSVEMGYEVDVEFQVQ